MKGEHIEPVVYSNQIRVNRLRQEEVVRLLRKGLTYKDIYDRIRVGYSQITVIAHANGFIRRNKVTFSDVPDIRRMREVERMSWTAIAKRFDVDHSTIIYHARKYGIGAGVVCQREYRSATVKAMRKRLKVWKTRVGLKQRTHLTKRIGKYDELFERDVINPGKSYAEYLKKSGGKLIPHWHIIEQKDRSNFMM